MKHFILFTGHMIDAKDRPEVRFPPGKENSVRKEINHHLLKIKQTITEEILGIAGGACGGDILFHELCVENNIASKMYLALPQEEFKKASVSFAGIIWEEKFDELTKKLPVHILSSEVFKSGNDNIWERSNLFMLDAALKNGGENTTMIALWDGKSGDGTGGTEHMVKVSKEQGAKTIIIDIKKL